MSNNENVRRIVLSPEQKAEYDLLCALGMTHSQARLRVLTEEQRQEFYQQIRASERRRYEKNPYRELVKRARHSANSRRRRGAKHGAYEFNLSEDQLVWPTHCPVFGFELHYPGRYKGDPAGASLDRVNPKKGYTADNVRVISLRANLLRKDMTLAELSAMFYAFVPSEFDDYEEE
jgi:hypothetical protein